MSQGGQAEGWPGQICVRFQVKIAHVSRCLPLVIMLIVLPSLVYGLISLVVTLIVVGVLLWLVNNYIPMDRQISRILNGAVVIAVFIWLLNSFGLLDSIRAIRVGK